MIIIVDMETQMNENQLKRKVNKAIDSHLDSTIELLEQTASDINVLAGKVRFIFYLSFLKDKLNENEENYNE